jgi:hypothetical protein
MAKEVGQPAPGVWDGTVRFISRSFVRRRGREDRIGRFGARQGHNRISGFTAKPPRDQANHLDVVMNASRQPRTVTGVEAVEPLQVIDTAY